MIIRPEIGEDVTMEFASVAREMNKKNIDIISFGLGEPDFSTPKHIIDASKKGFKSYILFLVQIENMKYFKIAKDIDKDYYENYLIAKKCGVQFLAYKCKIDPKEIKIDKKIKIIDE